MAPPTIKVDGVDYPLMIDDMTLDEACWFYEIAGVGPEAFADIDQGFNPKLIKGLICLTIARSQTTTPHKEIEEHIGQLSMTELGEVFSQLNEEAEDESPPVPAPADASPGEPSGSSGNGSNGDGDTSPEEPDPSSTGSPASGTGFTSFHGTSVR